MVLKKLLFYVILFCIIVGTSLSSVSNAEAEEYSKSCGQKRGIDLVFVLDDSGSMTTNDPGNLRISEAINLVNSLQVYDRSSVIKFNTEAENIQSLTYDRDLIINALSSLSPSGGTNISPGIQLALNEFVEHGGNNHKIVVLLTDGVPNDPNDNTKSQELADRAAAKNITLYTIGLGSGADSSLLTDIAERTGGQYFSAANASQLSGIFAAISNAMEENREPKVYSDWTLTKDLHMEGDLVLEENMKMDLNGYDLQVDGDLVVRSCAELRAVSGKITAGSLEQGAGAVLHLNNSQLEVKGNFTQDGLLRVNGDYKHTIPEIIVNGDYIQKKRGVLDLNGFDMLVQGNLEQDGRIDIKGGKVDVKQNVVQKGYLDLGKGELYISENLYINGGPLVDEEFKKNKSLNVNGGYLKVGSAESMDKKSKTGNVIQNSGQLYVNYGVVEIFGNYHINDGWLTMIHSTMDTSSDSLMVDDGDYVHVYGDFMTKSNRNHAARTYNYLGQPMNDQGHLMDGILRVDGNFIQIGDKQYHSVYSDRSQGYDEEKSYSTFNFAAAGKHKVILTGKGIIEMNGSGSTFNILQLDGVLGDYTRTGQVRWNQLKETSLSANADLASLTINDLAVYGFNPNILSYYNHTVPAKGITGPLQQLKVDARAKDHRNAKVEVTGDYIGEDGTAKVKILVTAHDGVTKKLYTVNVTVGESVPGKVTGIDIEQSELIFIKESSQFSPEKATLSYKVLPNNAYNQKVNWTSTNPEVAQVDSNGIVTPVGVGITTIVAETEEGEFFDSLNVTVTLPHDLLEGIHTLADFVSDNDRYNKIMALYDPDKIGIVVPGRYIEKVTFTSMSYLVTGKIYSKDNAVERIEVLINGQQLSVQSLNTSRTEYSFSRAGLQIGDYIEVIAYNSAGDELERISTPYPVKYERDLSIPYGFYSVKDLINQPEVFNQILDRYSLADLRFAAR